MIIKHKYFIEFQMKQYEESAYRKYEEDNNPFIGLYREEDEIDSLLGEEKDIMKKEDVPFKIVPFFISKEELEGTLSICPVMDFSTNILGDYVEIVFLRLKEEYTIIVKASLDEVLECINELKDVSIAKLK